MHHKLMELYLTVLCKVIFYRCPVLYLCMTIGMTILFPWPLYIFFVLHGSKLCLHNSMQQQLAAISCLSTGAVKESLVLPKQ